MGWIVCSQKKWRGRTYEKSFSGTECVDFLMEKMNFTDRSQAIQTATILMERCFIHRVDFKDSFSEKALYRFYKVCYLQKKKRKVY